MKYSVSESRWPLFLFGLSCLFLCIKILSVAAIQGDSYITFRVIDNLVNGYGLRWNTDERVQVYTHPLWMLLHIPFYALFKDFYLVTVFLSAACAIAAVALILTSVPASLLHKTVLVILPLYLSVTFNEYAICGLENPLSFLLIAWFIREWITEDYLQRRYRLYFIAALCILNRFDNALLLVPALLWLTWTGRKTLRAKPLLAATLPLSAWLAFSLFYYGFLMPNTMYAKIDTGVAPEDYVVQGLKYLFNFFYYDALSFTFIAAGIAWLLYCFFKGAHTHGNIYFKPAVLAAGIVFHVIYIITIGGDYMSGRFFADIFVAMVAIAFALLYRSSQRTLFFIMAGMWMVYALNAFSIVPDNLVDPDKNYGIDDHTREQYPYGGLLSAPYHFFRRHITLHSINRPDWFDDDGHYRHVIVSGFIDILGIVAGPHVIVIDLNALTDPLLARLPAGNPVLWRIGHFTRALPEGYVYARETGDTSMMDPSLALYYQKLRLVTSGDLMSLERLKAIIGFQLGWYDHWRDEYVAGMRH